MYRMVGESDAWHVGTNTIAHNRDVTSRYGLFYSLRLFTEVYLGVLFTRFILELLQDSKRYSSGMSPRTTSMDPDDVINDVMY